MSNVTSSAAFFLDLAKAKTVMTRRFDNRLSFHGLGFSDFMILFYLEEAPNGKLRRTDLAEKVGLTPSGITRMLLPMEKIGLVKREVNKDDARVSFVAIAPGGKRRFAEALESVEVLSEDLIGKQGVKKIAEFSEFLKELGKTIVY